MCKHNHLKRKLHKNAAAIIKIIRFDRCLWMLLKNDSVALVRQWLRIKASNYEIRSNLRVSSLTA